MIPSYKLNKKYLTPIKGEQPATDNTIPSINAEKKASLLLDDYYKVVHYSGAVQEFLYIDYAPINQFILDVEPKFKNVSLADTVKNVKVFGETITNIIKVGDEYFKFIAKSKKLGIDKVGVELTFLELNQTKNVQSAILEYSSDWHFCISRDGIITDYHSRRSKFCNVPTPVLGKHIDCSYPDALAENLMQGVTQAIKKGGYEYEGKNLSIDGMCFFVAKFYKIDAEHVFVKIQDITQNVIVRKTLERENRQYRTAFDNSPNGMAIISPKGRFMHSNQMLNAMLDISTKSLKYYSLDTFFLKFIANGEIFIKKLRNFEENIEFSARFVKDLNSSNAKISLRNVYDKLGEVQYIILTVNVEETNSQKVVINTISKNATSKIEELEHFAYAVSHDLREPLRTIKSFAGLLNKKYSEQLDDEAREYFNFILEGTANMNMLIEDLLSYSKTSLNSSDDFYEKIHLDELIKTIITRNLHQQIEETNAQVILEPSVQRVKGVHIKLMQLFQNLISNAIKFRQPNSIPVVKIRMQEDETHYNFEVSDNGIGIKADYLDKIFKVFRKLHNNRQYKGSGIGLAICKKIVEQHKGNIYVTSIVGKGTTVHFSLKKSL